MPELRKTPAGQKRAGRRNGKKHENRLPINSAEAGENVWVEKSASCNTVVPLKNFETKQWPGE